MSKSITGLLKITFYDPDTGDVAQFNTVKNEGQLSLNPIDGDEDSSGGIPYAGDQSELEVITYDLGAAEAQLEAWMQANKRISVVGLGHQVNFLWQERDRVRTQRPVFFAPGTRKQSTITMQKAGGVHKIDHMMNLLHNDKLLSIAGNTRRFPFPIEGARLTLSRDFSGGDANITIKALAFDGVTELQAVTGDQASPRTSATITLPAGTYYVECDLGQAGGNPALRSDGQTGYVNE